jgi:hypothetical protein
MAPFIPIIFLLELMISFGIAGFPHLTSGYETGTHQIRHTEGISILVSKKLCNVN